MSDEREQASVPAPATGPPSASAPEQEDPRIDIEQFSRVELRAAKVVEASEIEGADRLLKLVVDLGQGDERRQLVAGIKMSYAPDELVGKTIVVVANLKPARLRGVESNGMLLAAQTDDGPVLATFDADVSPGSLVK